MDGQESSYNSNLPASHYTTMIPPLTTDMKYNLYDTNANENKPFNDVNGMLQQIMSIVDQSLDEAQSRFVQHAHANEIDLVRSFV